MLAYIKQFLAKRPWQELGTKLVSYEQCPDRFTLSACMGIYIAFSPFFGLHTAMVFLLSWCFALNLAIVLTVSMLVNNPWTMIPVYGSGYMFGDWVMSMFGITANHNPAWMQSFNGWIHHYTGLSGISFWGFLIGGNILGVGLSLLAYPFIKKYAIFLKNKGTEQAKITFVAARQAVNKAKRKIKRSPEMELK
jgi:uncharacterized protein (DUF2062 family)